MNYMKKNEEYVKKCEKEHCDVLYEILKWPNWKKKSAYNNTLADRSREEIPLYIEEKCGLEVNGANDLEELDTMMLVDASFEYLDLDGKSYTATDEIVPFLLVKKQK